MLSVSGWSETNRNQTFDILKQIWLFHAKSVPLRAFFRAPIFSPLDHSIWFVPIKWIHVFSFKKFNYCFIGTWRNCCTKSFAAELITVLIYVGRMFLIRTIFKWSEQQFRDWYIKTLNYWISKSFHDIIWTASWHTLYTLCVRNYVRATSFD